MLCVQPYNNNISPNFKAIKIAETYHKLNNIETRIDLYKLQPQDKIFLEKLRKRIDYKKLFNKFSAQLLDRWQKIFNYCLDVTIHNDNVAYLAVSENKPCGIVTYYSDKNMILDGICSIPIGENRKATRCGDTLFYQIFKDAKDGDYHKIKLKAVTDGPYDVISKYEKCGFKREYAETSEYEEMTCTNHRIKDQLHRLSKEIEYIECDEHVNLNQFLD